MEEAWELAALVMIKSDVDKKFDWAWSAKHTRLRYQTISSALLFLTFCRFEAKSFNLPFSIADFTENPKQIEFVIGTAIFYIFSLTSFIILSRNEKNALDPAESTIIQNTELIITRLSDFTAPINLLGVEAAQNLQNLIDDITEYMKDLGSDTSAAHQYLQMMKVSVEKVKDSFFSLHRSNKQADETIGSVAIMDSLSDSDRWKKLQHLRDAFLKDRYLSEMEQSIRSLSSDFSLANDTLSRVTNVNERDENFLSQINNSIKKIESLTAQELIKIDNLKTTLENDSILEIRSLNSEIKRINKKAKNDMKFNSFERDWLGYKIPMFASMFIASLGAFLLCKKLLVHWNFV